jgi:hypothetical protein
MYNVIFGRNSGKTINGFITSLPAQIQIVSIGKLPAMLRKKKVGLTVRLVLLSVVLSAKARAALPDSITFKPKAKFGFSLIFDNRNSFVRDSPVKINGLNVGIKYKERYRFGVGAYAMRRDYTDHTYVSTHNPKDTVQPFLALSFVTPNFAYTFLNHPWLELSIPVEVGLGKSHYSLRNTREQLIKDHRGMFMPATLGFGLLLKPTRWVGFSSSAGYRISLMATDFKGNFDGWYYSYRVNVFLGNILTDYRQSRERKRQSRQPIAPTPQF